MKPIATARKDLFIFTLQYNQTFNKKIHICNTLLKLNVNVLLILLTPYKFEDTFYILKLRPTSINDQIGST